MILERLTKSLIHYEGFTDTVYSKNGVLMGGVGHVLCPEEIEKYPEHTVVSDTTLANWLYHDVMTAIERATNILEIHSYFQLDSVRQEVLANMAFSLKNRLVEFTVFLEAVKSKEYSRAAAEIINSSWCREVGIRALELEASMRTSHAWEPSSKINAVYEKLKPLFPKE